MGKRVLLTGHNGYIGSVMTPALMEAGYKVVGLDTGYFEECTLGADTPRVQAIRKDIRDLTLCDLRGFHSVIHLAALSNDPIGNLSERWTEEINFEASVQLAELARRAGVKRFLFSSSCIMYGMSQEAVATEESPLAPRTEYARSKVKAEKSISALAEEGFSPTFLRNGTVYGFSPRMRFDTVLNDLMGQAFTTGQVTVHSDGTPWRPVVHVQDVARFFLAVLEAPVHVVHNQAFNVGANELNCRVIDLAELVVSTVPSCRLEVKGEPGADQRTYKAEFGKFESAFPDSHPKWTPAKGARDLYESLRAIELSHHQFVDRRFTRLKWLRFLLQSSRLDNKLRWQTAADRSVGTASM